MRTYKEFDLPAAIEFAAKNARAVFKGARGTVLVTDTGGEEQALKQNKSRHIYGQHGRKLPLPLGVDCVVGREPKITYAPGAEEAGRADFVDKVKGYMKDASAAIDAAREQDYDMDSASAANSRIDNLVTGVANLYAAVAQLAVEMAVDKAKR